MICGNFTSFRKRRKSGPSHLIKRWPSSLDPHAALVVAAAEAGDRQGAEMGRGDRGGEAAVVIATQGYIGQFSERVPLARDGRRGRESGKLVDIKAHKRSIACRDYSQHQFVCPITLDFVRLNKTPCRFAIS